MKKIVAINDEPVCVDQHHETTDTCATDNSSSQTSERTMQIKEQALSLAAEHKARLAEKLANISPNEFEKLLLEVLSRGDELEKREFEALVFARRNNNEIELYTKEFYLFSFESEIKPSIETDNDLWRLPIPIRKIIDRGQEQETLELVSFMNSRGDRAEIERVIEEFLDNGNGQRIQKALQQGSYHNFAEIYVEFIFKRARVNEMESLVIDFRLDLDKEIKYANVLSIGSLRDLIKSFNIAQSLIHNSAERMRRNCQDIAAHKKEEARLSTSVSRSYSVDDMRKLSWQQDLIAQLNKDGREDRQDKASSDKYSKFLRDIMIEIILCKYSGFSDKRVTLQLEKIISYHFAPKPVQTYFPSSSSRYSPNRARKSISPSLVRLLRTT
jgi:hypothetical protein